MDACTEFLQTRGAPEEAIFAANLALEEMITNTIKYGYGEQVTGEVRIQLELEKNRLVLILEDDSAAFDPFNQAPPDLSLPVEERPIGGLGLHLVKNLMSACHHHREAEKNIIRMEKVWD
jgi:anti-sigma regulatory factor (Ser/Thr protein kinase)